MSMLEVSRNDRSQIAFKDKVAVCCKFCFFRDLLDGSVPLQPTVPSCHPTKPAGKLTISIHLCKCISYRTRGISG